MCGIAGGFFSRGTDFDDVIGRSLNKIRHRGPDDQGYNMYPLRHGALALGHTRLSIIDLTRAGHQPMHSEDDCYAIVFNGEIYNYRELREELKRLGYGFSSATDTEVLLNAWREWGASSLKKFDGMFAFVVFDKKNNKLTCARDAFGIKPFYYSYGSQGWCFSSELPSLLELMSERPLLNHQRAYDYLVYGSYDVGDETFYKNVFHLLPGHYLEYDLESCEILPPVCWWEPEIKEKSWKFNEAVECVREEFLKNIRLHMRSDVAIGAALSGGIDSSAVVCAMRHVDPEMPIHTFSYIASDSELSEEYWVDRVNQHVGSFSHKVAVSTQELASDLDAMILAQGEPFGSTSIYAQYRVFKLAKEAGVTVTLDGQGADEMLAGYSGYPGPRLRSLIEIGRFSEAFSFTNEWSKWPGRSRKKAIKNLIGELTQGKLYHFFRYLNGTAGVPDWINKERLIDEEVCLSPPRFRPAITKKGRRLSAELAQALTKVGLPALLRHGDRNSMAFSVESRVPFLTLGMANALLSMPENYLLSNKGETKHVFRAAMRGIVPDDVLDRKDKIGFATPEKDLLFSNPKMIREWLQVDLGLDFLDQRKILVEFEMVLAGKKPFSLQIWRWINFIRWYQRAF